MGGALESCDAADKLSFCASIREVSRNRQRLKSLPARKEEEWIRGGKRGGWGKGLGGEERKEGKL